MAQEITSESQENVKTFFKVHKDLKHINSSQSRSVSLVLYNMHEACTFYAALRISKLCELGFFEHSGNFPRNELMYVRGGNSTAGEL